MVAKVAGCAGVGHGDRFASDGVIAKPLRHGNVQLVDVLTIPSVKVGTAVKRGGKGEKRAENRQCRHDGARGCKGRASALPGPRDDLRGACHYAQQNEGQGRQQVALPVERPRLRKVLCARSGEQVSRRKNGGDRARQPAPPKRDTAHDPQAEAETVGEPRPCR